MMKKKLTIPPNANIALYWSRVWLKMQRKGMTPATKNLERVIVMSMEEKVMMSMEEVVMMRMEEMVVMMSMEEVVIMMSMEKKEDEGTFSWFVAWQALRKMTCRADSQKWIEQICSFFGKLYLLKTFISISQIAILYFKT